MSINFSQAAVANLTTIHDYIHVANPEAARGTIGQILEAASRLEKFPVAGRAGRLPGTREFAIPDLPYACVYRARPEGVEITSVVHNTRHWP